VKVQKGALDSETSKAQGPWMLARESRDQNNAFGIIEMNGFKSEGPERDLGFGEIRSPGKPRGGHGPANPGYPEKFGSPGCPEQQKC